MTRWERLKVAFARFKGALVRLGIGGLIVGFLLGIGALAYFAPLFPEWTGFAADPVPSGTAVTPIVVYQPAKTLYDWLQLLLVPLVLAVGGFILTRSENRYALQLQERREKEAREVEDRQLQETRLQAYFDYMSDLLLHERLRTSKPNDEVRSVARVRTLTLLSILDAQKKSTILEFLFEARLISCDNVGKIVDLDGANLRGVSLAARTLRKINLQGTNLQKAFLPGADLAGADLREAILEGAALAVADLREADLTGAFLAGAFLRGANLTGADLTGAFLAGADLIDCLVTPEQLASAKSIEGAKLSFDMPEAATAPPAP